MATTLADFAEAYAGHRAAEGRGYAQEHLLALPYLREGPFARQWAVRSRSYEALQRRVVQPLAKRLRRPLEVLDLGAGNGWLSSRLAGDGHLATAIDIREDAVDGLGAAQHLESLNPERMRRLAASFDSVPLPEAVADLAIFNASLHYAMDLSAALSEASRLVRLGGQIAIVDSPFYARTQDGEAMVAEKRANATQMFGSRADALTTLPFIEYLTRQRLDVASASLRLSWRRHRVVYPLWYELRPLQARLQGRRAPSRFDLWVSDRP
jgi:SAM-dependent methyltransferase